jgi:hypothetical protein
MSTEQPGYGERDDEPTTPQTGGDPDDLRPVEQAERGTGDNPDVGGIGDGPRDFGGTPEGARFDADAGGRAHTAPGEGHPAGDGARSGRDVGGPTADEGQGGSPGTEPGGRGDIATKGFEPHE